MAPTRNTCDEKEYLVGRVDHLVDEVEIDVNKTTFAEKVRKLEEHLFGAHKEGTFLECCLTLEGGKGIGLFEHDESNHVDQAALRHEFNVTEGATPLGELVGIEELIIGNSTEGSASEHVQSLKSILVSISTNRYY